MGFLGNYTHTLDPKGRVFVPKKFLAALEEKEPRHFIVTKGLDGCLSFYTASSWQKTVDKMDERAEGDGSIRKFKRVFFANASQQDIDKSGRVLLPEELRKMAGLKRDVVFVGMNDRIELWDRQTWDDFNDDAAPGFEEFAAQVLQ